MKRDEPPSPQIVKTDKGLKPYRAWDAEALMADPVGTIYEAKPYSPRKAKGHRTYWLAFKRVVQATDKWPSKEKLCEELKYALGYRTKFRDWRTGNVLERPDSIALSKMSKEVSLTDDDDTYDETPPLPCPFCGGPARTFQYNGTTQATCAKEYVECAGTDVMAPVGMWNKRHEA